MPPEIQAGAANVLQLLRGEREFVSPLFQRRYVWTESQLRTLWEDIDGVIEGEAGTRFLGALVLEVKAAGLAFQPDSFWIVDGQQRLTSLYLILLTIAMEAERAGIEDLSTTLYKQYLFNQDGDYRDRPKLRPTLPDYKQFGDAFQGVKTFTPKLEVQYGDPRGQLQKSAVAIKRSVLERCQNDEGRFSEDKARELVIVILEQLKFVQIVLGETQDAHQVFDRLNTGGIRLENKDLIRNIVFEKVASDPSQAEAIYRTKWIPFEEELGPKLDDYFFPFALIHRPTATKATVLATLRARWNDQVQKDGSESHGKSPSEILADLQTYVDVFKAIAGRSDEMAQKITESPELLDAICRMQRMRVPSSTYPFLMRVLQGYRDESISLEWAVSNLLLVESFLVRRSVAGFEPTGLHAVFKGLFAETEGDPEKFIGVIEKSATVQFPSDSQFAQDVQAKPLYGRKLAPYILYEYERALDGGDPVPEVEITIDHIMPQKLSEVWKQVITPETHARLKDTWANLTPLSIAANAEKGQNPWPYIRNYFQTETVFKTTKRLAANYNEWDEKTITERGKQLALWAVDHWAKKA